MTLKILNISKRRAVFEIENNSPYYSEVEYKILLDGKHIKNTSTNVFDLEDLLPERKYELELEPAEGHEFLKLDFETEREHVRLNVRRFGAKGSGREDDTLAIQAAIMACPMDGTVYIPKGIYKVTSIFLKDNITIEMAEGSVMMGTEDRERMAVLPGFTETTDEKDEYYLGSWEGNPLDSFSSIITGINVKNVKFVGKGNIDGGTTKEGWWHDVKKRRGAWRPKLVSLINCEDIVFEGVKLTNSPAWTVHPIFSKNLKFLNLEITNPYDSPNTDGIDPESCKDVDIVGVRISVGDDCIAIKSGKIYLGKRLKRATENLNIRNCYMEKGHGSVVIGSEIAAGVKGVKIEKCIFYKTDKGLRIKTRRGRGKDSVLDEITCENIYMNEVQVPFVLNSFYFCDPDGKSEYVGSKKALPVDERTPSIKKMTFRKIKCDNAHITAGYLCGLPEKKVGKVEVEDVVINFATEAKAGVPAMMTECERVSKQGFYFENIEELYIRNLKVTGAEGREIITHNVDRKNSK